mmetsp:Transcript_10785/g.35388  ORF Transcript_10785/g.35388 Transcript_10785/m.35388 type:complete len:82 (-) Transcript_10785:12-257(-)
MPLGQVAVDAARAGQQAQQQAQDACEHHQVVCLEAGPRAGEGVSSRSSEVVHAGLYFTATISRSSASAHFFLVDCEKEVDR